MSGRSKSFIPCRSGRVVGARLYSWTSPLWAKNKAGEVIKQIYEVNEAQLCGLKAFWTTTVRQCTHLDGHRARISPGRPTVAPSHVDANTRTSAQECIRQRTWRAPGDISATKLQGVCQVAFARSHTKVRRILTPSSDQHRACPSCTTSIKQGRVTRDVGVRHGEGLSAVHFQRGRRHLWVDNHAWFILDSSRYGTSAGPPAVNTHLENV